MSPANYSYKFCLVVCCLNTCNVSRLASVSGLANWCYRLLLASMRSDFYVVAHEPFRSKQGTRSPALLSSRSLIFSERPKSQP